jgi:antirestriction protein
MSEAVFEVFVTNLGKYNEGELCGEWLKLPAEKKDVQALFGRIGVDGVLYEEFFITDYESDIDGLCRYMGEYESLDELNYLASLLSDLDEWEREKFEAAVQCGDYTGSVKDLINLTQNPDCYEFFPGVENEDDLGRYLIEELGWEDGKIPEWIQPYFDFEAYGRDFSIDEGGDFYDCGYVSRNDVNFEEHYDGRDVPEDYRIFAYPDTDKMTVKARMEMYQNLVTAAAPADRHARTQDISD